MAVFDKFVKTIYQYQANRLLAASGNPVMLTIGDKRQPLTAKPATQQQIEHLLKEILPAELSRVLDEEGRHQFPYHAPAGTVKVEIERTSDSLQLLAVPLVEEAPASALKGQVTPEVSEIEGIVGSVAGGVGVDPEHVSDPLETVSLTDPGEVSEPLPLSDTTLSGEHEEESSKGSGAAEPHMVLDSPAVETDLELKLAGSAKAAVQRMDQLFMTMVERSCSDLHLSTGNPPLFRKDGEIVSLGKTAPLSSDQVRELLLAITPSVKRAEFESCHDTDFAYEVPGLARFRCNLFLDRLGLGGVFRFIPVKIPRAEELGLSAQVLKLCHLNKGLVLVTGPTGSGKSTTLAALIDYINRHRTAHIITIEDPIEFVHPNRKCLINQREVGAHTDTFKKALRAALREDPDIVLVGEMRDLETIAIAIETAETGHLVFGTLHTTTAATTVDRIIDQFPADRQSQIRTMLAESLKAVIAQTLCKKNGGGQVAALELLFVTTAISNLIRESKTFQIPSIMQTGKSQGMATLNDTLLDLVKKKQVAPMEAYSKSIGKSEFRSMLDRNGFTIDVP